MSLEQTITSALKEAMKAKDQAALRGIRAVKAAILLAKTDGTGKGLDSAGEIRLLQKLVKQRQDSLDIYEKQGREDLAVVEREEIEVIQRFLPTQMDESALTSLIEGVIGDTGASGMKDMGKVMGIVSQKVAGQADGKTVAAIVKQLLNR